MANTTNLPNNTSFTYPLQKVSTLECRTLYRNDMPESCKINLPRIHWANYTAYQSNELYRSIYTTLWAAPYSDSWNQKVWAHAWVDIATARGTPLYSIWDGEVYSAWWNSAYWNLVRIKYIYNWEVVYWVYAHMDTISVKAWDKVTRWQRIWTVWNSGNTFWELWWYHVHFEIAKDSFGRPAYAYANCPDLSKWHYRIIQNGLCRTELVSYQYDPIRILEAWSSYVAPVEKKEEPVNVPSDNNLVNTGSSSNSSNTNANPTSNNSNSTSNNSNPTSNNSNTTNNNSNSTIDKRNDIINNNPNNHNSPSTNTNDQNSSNTKPSEPDPIKDTIDENLKKDPLLIDLDFTWLKDLAEHFSRLWDVEMRSELNQRSLMLWETITLDVEIFKKWNQLNKTWNYYNWVLNVPFMFLLNNDVVNTNINSLQLITKWKAKIEITWNKVGKSTLVIKLDDKKIWSLDIIVR